ncbi:SRPBCC family protein [Clostridium sp.]|uniref:SRPBCC family protein n=1 Tax=Clostridium sp. TaxID=1506 RepID=UPI00284AC5E8|nr:SRPBCC family protein [Clostridium sp.]MDR3595604.1 SRPBCC family protein [Clostridium sp.]
MAISNKKVYLKSDIEKVWNIVTSLGNYKWRSDIVKIEMLEKGKKFVEYTKDGYKTIFTITHFESEKRYEFDMENENMKGHWIGIFSKYSDGTLIDFTEDVNVKKIIMKPFAKIYLKNQQKCYINDLKKELNIR